MANTTLITKIALRNDALSNWNVSEDRLLRGEVALGQREDSKYEVRIGVGDKTWNELSGSNMVIPAENVIGLTNTIQSLSTSMYQTDDIAKLSDVYTNGSFHYVQDVKHLMETIQRRMFTSRMT